MAADTPIPDEPHRRSLRWDDWLVRRISARRVRVTSPEGYVDVTMGRGATVADATDAAASAVKCGDAAWTPVPTRAGGRTWTDEDRVASGLTKLVVWLSPEAEAGRRALTKHFGSARAAAEYAFTQVPPPPPKTGA